MSADGSWVSSEFSFGVSSSSEMDRGWWHGGKVEEEQAAVSSSHSIRAMLGVSSVATSTGDPGKGTYEAGGGNVGKF